MGFGDFAESNFPSEINIKFANSSQNHPAVVVVQNMLATSPRSDNLGCGQVPEFCCIRGAARWTFGESSLLRIVDFSINVLRSKLTFDFTINVLRSKLTFDFTITRVARSPNQTEMQKIVSRRVVRGWRSNFVSGQTDGFRRFCRKQFPI